jgi:hypothetical protein
MKSEKFYEVFGRKVTKEEMDRITVEMELTELGNIMARLHSKGVDRRIIADTLINSVEYRDLSELCGSLDAYLRAMPKY